VPAKRADARSARTLLKTLKGVEEGTSYGMPSFKLGGKFFARLRDDDTVLVLQLGTIEDRDVLMGLAADAFFFTDHYRDYPAVLIRLEKVDPAMLCSVVTDAWQELSTRRSRKGRR